MLLRRSAMPVRKLFGLILLKKTITEGKSFRLKAKGKAAKGRLKWRSSNKKIASVTAKGKVTAKKTGKVKITVQSVKKPSLKAVCTVTVKKKKMAVPTESSKPDSSAAPVPISTSPAPATAGVSSAPQVTQEPPAPTATVSPVPADPSTLVVSTSLVEKDGMTMTAYLINKQYYGNITVCLNGKTYTKKTSGRNLLFTLATGATGGTPEVNHDGTIRVRQGKYRSGVLDSRGSGTSEDILSEGRSAEYHRSFCGRLWSCLCSGGGSF